VATADDFCQLVDILETVHGQYNFVHRDVRLPNSFRDQESGMVSPYPTTHHPPPTTTNETSSYASCSNNVTGVSERLGLCDGSGEQRDFLGSVAARTPETEKHLQATV
jgi:hypothetical protein